MTNQKSYPITVIEDTNTSFEGERLRMYYIPLEEAVLWDENPKEHAISDLIRSIRDNGFGDPPKWDKNLNNGKGGLVFGNGRTHAVQWMKHNEEKPPRGVAYNPKTKQWAIPVLFGVDAESEKKAKRFALDHNNLPLLGGNFTAHDMSRLYNPDKYLAILDDLGVQDAMPITVDDEDLSALKLAVNNMFGDDKGLDPSSSVLQSLKNASVDNFSENGNSFDKLEKSEKTTKVDDRFPVIKARVRPDYYETYLEVTSDFGDTDDERIEGLLSQYVKARKKPYLD